MSTIAIIGMGCRYPDANSPAELWENVLAQRQAFRRIPRERLDPDGYHSDDPAAPDVTYSRHAAVLTDYVFDRTAFRISRATYESTDLAHWLALDGAAAAWSDTHVEVDPQRVGVVLGNTLTGDSSRASLLRLRWPYVRRVLESMLDGRQLAEAERRFKAPFAPVTEDTLAGSLSNTIAGRICNHFGFGGGGYSVDGACSSSLLAVIQACQALEAGDLDVALAGGVDVSLDPLELVGFAKTSALARERMWVYDAKSNGFLPGEGCGFVVLMRKEDALRQSLRVYSSIVGRGISSDGHGGLTRPEIAGQKLAVQRACDRAGIALDSVSLFEGHGTGTPVGDAVELAALDALLTAPGERWIGSVKANIGHTKAAAGIAGLIKATLAAWHGVIPPATACTEPRPEARTPKLGIAKEARAWPEEKPRRASVSAMGFGGINTHVLLESDRSVASRCDVRGAQEAELFVFSDAADIAAVRDCALSLSLAEMADLAAMLAHKTHDGAERAAVVASTPEELYARLGEGTRVRGTRTSTSDGADLLERTATAFASGENACVDQLFAGRFTRPFDLKRRPRFIESPCERVGHPAAAPMEDSPADASSDALTLLRTTIAARTELARELVHESSQMLGDLHFSSIAVARVVTEVARQLGIASVVDAMQFANATVGEIAAALQQLRAHAADPPPPERIPHGIADWTRAFHVIDVDVPLCGARRSGPPQWRFAGSVRPELVERFARVPGRGLLLVPPDDRDGCIAALLDSAASLTASDRLVVAEEDARAAAFARSLHLERPSLSVRIVRSRDVERIAAEAAAEGEYAEAVYGLDGVRREPRVVLAPDILAPPALTAADTVVVSGGAKGIGAETAIHLARTTGARLILLGRSPADDREVRTSLERLRTARTEYLSVDITDLPALHTALAGLRPDAIIHAAGSNIPALIESLDASAFDAATSAKLDGLANLLTCCDCSGLRILATFGSVIARSGMRGEAHYAFANEWLARMTQEYGRAHPRCRAVCVEWSVWPGAGMGARLGAVESLRAIGVTPIDPEQGLTLFDHALAAGPSRVTIAGRLGDPPTVQFLRNELPLLRFVESIDAHTPGVELIAQARLSAARDPYVDDHVLGDEPLLPAVMALEAMAQITAALTGHVPRTFRAVELRRPIVVPPGNAVTMRVAALGQADRVKLAVRSSDTEFATDHFRAVASTRAEACDESVNIAPDIVLHGDEVYPLLFHRGRFRRVVAYRALGARHCTAGIDTRPSSWFHRYAPQQLLLGNPGVRDAAIHALQACVPQAVVLPTAIESIELYDALPTNSVFVAASETGSTRDSFTYDLDLTTATGRIVERWRGLRLQIVATRAFEDVPQPLWGVYLERAIGNETLRVVFSNDGSDAAIRNVARSARPPVRSADGKPHIAGTHVSASHADGITLAVAHETAVGCDLQHVAADAASLLADTDRSLTTLASGASREPDAVVATRVWSAREAMKKATGNGNPPLVFDCVSTQGQVTFSAGPFRIETFLLCGRIAAVALQSGQGGPR